MNVAVTKHESVALHNYIESLVANNRSASHPKRKIATTTPPMKRFGDIFFFFDDSRYYFTRKLVVEDSRHRYTEIER